MHDEHFIDIVERTTPDILTLLQGSTISKVRSTPELPPRLGQILDHRIEGLLQHDVPIQTYGKTGVTEKQEVVRKSWVVPLLASWKEFLI